MLEPYTGTRCTARRMELINAKLDELEGVGCAVDSRERIHQKIVIIDGRIVWHGSLNALSYAQRSEELMTRLVNAESARVMAAILAKRRVHFTKALDRIADPENRTVAIADPAHSIKSGARSMCSPVKVNAVGVSPWRIYPRWVEMGWKSPKTSTSYHPMAPLAHSAAATL